MCRNEKRELIRQYASLKNLVNTLLMATMLVPPGNRAWGAQLESRQVRTDIHCVWFSG